MNARDIDFAELHDPIAGESYRSVTVYAASGQPLHSTSVMDKEGADAVRNWATLLLKAADLVDPPEEEVESPFVCLSCGERHGPEEHLPGGSMTW